jgi:MGT family glycosyltransferase
VYTEDQSKERKKSKNEWSNFLEDALKNLASFYQQNPPNVIIYDLVAFAGRILAARMHTPAIQTSPSFAHDRAHLARQIKDPSMRKSELDLSNRMDQFLGEYGIQSRGFLFHREALNIYLFPRAIQPCAEALGDGCFFAGRCAGEQLSYGSWRRPETEGRPIVLVATSTHYQRGPDHFGTWIKALMGLEWHVILSIGDDADPAALNPLPPHFQVVQHTSHISILPFASLFICLGGIISTAESLYHGVPLLVTSHGYPELEWQADNLVSLGLAVHLSSSDMNIERLRDAAIEAMRDTAMRENIERIQRVVRREPGSEETSNRIEEFMERRGV